MRLAALVALLTTIIALSGCQSPSPTDSHHCLVTPNQTVECSEVQ
jgi:hypothetical protein